MDAIIWRKRAYSPDQDVAKTDPWDVRPVSVTPLGSVCIQVRDLRDGRFLSKGFNLEQDQEQTTLYARPLWEDKTKPGIYHPKLSHFHSIEGLDPLHRDRVRWEMLPLDLVPEYRVQLESTRQDLQKKRQWAQMGLVAERIQILEKAMGPFFA